MEGLLASLGLGLGALPPPPPPADAAAAGAEGAASGLPAAFSVGVAGEGLNGGLDSLKRQLKSMEAGVPDAKRSRRGTVACRFFMNGPDKCKHGANCTFSHDPEVVAQALSDGSVAPIPCKYFFATGTCRNSGTCFFSHDRMLALAAQEMQETQPTPAANAASLTAIGPTIYAKVKYACRYHLAGPGKCRNGDQCKFSHEPDALPMPEGMATSQKLGGKGQTSVPAAFLTLSFQAKISAGSNRKTKICQFWLTGSCNRGDACTFAHGEHELVGSGGSSFGESLQAASQASPAELDLAMAALLSASAPPLTSVPKVVPPPLHAWPPPTSSSAATGGLDRSFAVDHARGPGAALGGAAAGLAIPNAHASAAAAGLAGLGGVGGLGAPRGAPRVVLPPSWLAATTPSAPSTATEQGPGLGGKAVCPPAQAEGGDSLGICKWFLKGECWLGSTCKSSHDAALAAMAGVDVSQMLSGPLDLVGVDGNEMPPGSPVVVPPPRWQESWQAGGGGSEMPPGAPVVVPLRERQERWQAGVEVSDTSPAPVVVPPRRIQAEVDASEMLAGPPVVVPPRGGTQAEVDASEMLAGPPVVVPPRGGTQDWPDP